MGRYFDLLENMSVSDYNLTYTPKNDTITDAFTVAKDKTEGWLGVGFLSFAWFLLFSHIAKQENRFGLTVIQSIISVNTLIFCIALIMLYTGVMANIQVFIWCVLLIFFAQIWGTLRTTV